MSCVYSFEKRSLTDWVVLDSYSSIGRFQPR